MAADSSIDDTEAAAPAAEEKAAGFLDKPNGPPRPPRPVRRMSGSLRIPLPSAITPGSKLGAPRAESAPRVGAGVLPPSSVIVESSFAAEPSVLAESHASIGSSVTLEPVALEDISLEPVAPEPARTMPSPGAPPRQEGPRRSSLLDPQNIPTPLPPLRPSTRPPPALVSPALPGDAATNIEFSLTRRSSGAPPLSFDSDDVDPSDRAPVAPLTPWRDVPPLKEAPELSSPAVDARADNGHEETDHEETIVGQVPKDLLELSSEEDQEENTRAYQAPQELIDLARREREERRQSQAKQGQKKQDAKSAFADSLPPAARAVAELDYDQSDVLTATVPLDSFPASGAAPPVARSGAVRGTPSGEPSLGRKVSNGPASLEELARAVSRPRERESIPVVSEVLSEDRTPDSLRGFSGDQGRWLTRGRAWTLLVGLIIVVGFALARWGGVQLPLSR